MHVKNLSLFSMVNKQKIVYTVTLDDLDFVAL